MKKAFGTIELLATIQGCKKGMRGHFCRLEGEVYPQDCEWIKIKEEKEV